MCKYCRTLSKEFNEPEDKLHKIFDRLFQLRNAEGLYTLEIPPDTIEAMKEEEVI